MRKTFRAVQAQIAHDTDSTARRVAENELFLARDTQVSAALLQNIGPLLQSLRETRDAVVRIGALLIVKVEWRVQVFQLTVSQQAILDNQPELMSSPHEIVSSLELASPSEDESALPS
jgi:hypothetical protein